MDKKLIELSIDKSIYLQVTFILDKQGLDIDTYLSNCLTSLIEKNNSRGIELMKEFSRIAKENGIDNMSLEEINLEIAKAREESKKD